MSESMAFIGGVAVAGLAALLLLRGTGSPVQSNVAMPSIQMPTMSQMQPPAYTNPYQTQPLNPSPTAPTTDERIAMERTKMENEVLKKENEQLKSQIQQYQSQIQAYNYYQQQQQISNQQNLNSARLPQSPNPWWNSNIIWLVGGVTLTVGGGIVVAGVLSLFSPKQRSTRTIQVIHPYNGSGGAIAPVRRAEFLPPRNEVRRVEEAEYDDNY